MNSQNYRHRSDISSISRSYSSLNSSSNYSSDSNDYHSDIGSSSSSINSSNVHSLTNGSESYSNNDSNSYSHNDSSVCHESILDTVKYLCDVQNYDVCEKTRKLLEKVQLYLRVNKNENEICEYLKDHIFGQHAKQETVCCELRRYFFKYYNYNIYVVYECKRIEQLCTSSSYSQHALVFLSSKHSSDNQFVHNDLLPELNRKGVLYTEIYVTRSNILKSSCYNLEYKCGSLKEDKYSHKKHQKHQKHKNETTGKNSAFWLIIFFIILILILACYRRYRY